MDYIVLYLMICVSIIIGVPLVIRNEARIKCFLYGHIAGYAGRKSGMTFDGCRGISGTMRDIHSCRRCGKHLDY